VFEKSVACDQILLRGVFLNLVKNLFQFHLNNDFNLI
jgi:hypothetical protein